MGEEYHVRFTGQLQDGLDQESVVTNLTKLTNLSSEKAEALLSPGKPLLLKKNIELETAQKYSKVFEKAGLMIQIVKVAPTKAIEDPKTSTESVESPPQPSKNLTSEPVTPPPPPIQNKAPENPYEAPKADLKTRKESKGGWRDQPEKVPASHGWQWLKSAVSMFFEHPWTWMGMWLVLFISIMILNLIPIVGWFCTGLLGGVLSGGMMLAAQAQNNGEQVKISNVFLGFFHNRNQLLLVGLYYVLVILAFMLVIGSLVGFGILTGFHSGDPAAVEAMMKTRLPLLLVIALTGSLLSIPLMMAYWFAPALTAITDKTAWSAYKSSFVGCLKNWSAFLVFSLVLLVVGIVGIIIFSIVSGVFAFMLFNNGSFLAVFLPIILIALIGIPAASIMALTIFTGFKDIYYQSA